MKGRALALNGFIARWRWRGFAAVFGLTLSCCAAVVVWPIAAGYTEIPLYGKKVTQSALEDARRAAADRWAPEAMIAAEASVRAAYAEYRRQEVQFLPFRDFRNARAALDLAADKCRGARGTANRNRLDARKVADSALTAATREAARGEDVAEAMHLGSYNRTLLQKSRIALYEARSLYADGRYGDAASRARESTSQAQIVSRNALDAASRYTDQSLVSRWHRMIAETVDWSHDSGNPAIIVLKENHRLDLYDNGRRIRSYPADMGYQSVNAKLRSGDAATPEGRYRITAKKSASTYYKALALDYPNAEDRAEFVKLKRRGQLPHWASPGGLIEIHGEGGRGKDWTKGCIALSNDDVDDLFRRVGVGTPVTIVGGDGRGAFARLARENADAAARTQ
jgi:lipoprotein-anchoring transpeptidase ErfK/SrfK